MQKTETRIEKIEHDIEKAQFVLINEKGEAVVGGRDEIAAFAIKNSKLKTQNSFEIENINFDKNQRPKTKDQKPNELWRVKHKPPSRGVFRVVAGIALRAAALYFRYGGLATSALNIVRGANLARSRF